MDRETRTRIQRATQAARALLEREYAEQLEGTFDSNSHFGEFTLFLVAGERDQSFAT